jgi:outer membrane protein assembly factor BamB
MVLSVSEDGTLSAIDASTGNRRWMFQAEDVVHAAPALLSGHVVVASWDGMLHVLTFDGRHVGSAELGAARPTRMVTDTDLIVLFDLAGRAVRAFDVNLQADGVACTERWRVPTGKDSDVTPLLFGEQVYWVQREEGVITCVDASSGTSRWTQPGDGVPLAGAISGGRLIVATRDGQLAGLDSLTGDSLWRMRTSVSFSSPPAIADDVAYIGGTDRALYAIRLPELGD